MWLGGSGSLGEGRGLKCMDCNSAEACHGRFPNPATDQQDVVTGL